MRWHAADNLPSRRLLIFVSDSRITIPATSDALAKVRRDLVMVFRGSEFKAVYVLGWRLFYGR